MRILSQQFLIAVFALSSPVGLLAQQPQPTAWAVPRVVRVSSSFRPVNGLAVLPVENVQLAIYAEEVGGVALWQETQNVTMDGEGRFSVLLGSTRNEGLPLELFAAGEARWVGVQVQRPGEVEQPRVLLASVPYALKAVDADTLGGQPASAYLLAPSTAPSATGAGVGAANTDASIKPAKLTPKITSGTINNIAKFVNATDLGNSVMAESNGKIGIGTNVPAAALEIVTTGGGAQFTNTLANNFTFNTFSSPGNASYLYNFGNAYPTSGRFVQSSTLLDAGSILSLSASNHLRFYTNGSNERMRIDGSGNVGIGTLTPGTSLDVSGDISLSGSVFKGGFRFLHNLGTNNTAIGLAALSPTFTGTDNTATGFKALFAITSGSDNTASGSNALFHNNTGYRNTAVGSNALYANTEGSANIATGYGALEKNTTGSDNVGTGFQALAGNINGHGNVAIGFASGEHIINGDNNIDISCCFNSNPGPSDEYRTIRIGDVGIERTFIQGISNVNVSGAGVVINSSGQSGVASSSRRYKEDIQDMGDVSINLMRLRPVTYRYKKPYSDGSKPIDYGLIAEEVAEIYPDLVVKNKDGQIETVQYQKLTPMLLNEVQKLHFDAEKRRREIEALKVRLAGMSELETRLGVLEALLSTRATATSSSLQQP